MGVAWAEKLLPGRGGEWAAHEALAETRVRVSREARVRVSGIDGRLIKAAAGLHGGRGGGLGAPVVRSW